MTMSFLLSETLHGNGFSGRRAGSNQLCRALEAVEGGCARGAQTFDDRCAPVLVGDDLDTPRSLIPSVDRSSDEGGGVEITAAAVGPMVDGVIDDIEDGGIGPIESVIDLDGGHPLDGHDLPQIV